jgi:hypothetical protein
MKLKTLTNKRKFKKQNRQDAAVYVRQFGILKEEILWNFSDHMTHGNFIVRPIANSENSLLLNEGITLKYTLAINKY